MYFLYIYYNYGFMGRSLITVASVELKHKVLQESVSKSICNNSLIDLLSRYIFSSADSAESEDAA